MVNRDMTDELLKVGEFAFLCNTTKETLRHYKDIGLLCPITYADNGYALYSPLQLSDFLLITSLQHAGCSLFEIKSYLVDPDAKELDRVIVERIAAITHERKVLLQQKLLLENTLTRMRARLDWIYNPAPYKLEVCEAQYFIDSDALDVRTSFDTPAQEQALHSVRHILEVWDRGKYQDKVSELQGNYRVGLDAFLACKPQDDFHLCTRTRKHKGVESLIERPAGTYVKYLRVLDLEDATHYENALDELFAVYRDLKELLDQEEFVPTSDVFERELSVYTGRLDECIYSELSVRVVPA